MRDTRLLVPRAKKPVFDLFTHGAINSLDDYHQVEVRSDLLFPMAGRISTDPLESYGVVDVSWRRFAYSKVTSGIMFKDPEYRQHIAKLVRYEIAREVAEHWTINLHAVPSHW